MTLTEFLTARLDEDEAAARACADNDGNLGWWDSPVRASPGDHTIRTTGSRPVARIREADSRGDDSVPRILSPDAVAAHIVRSDPDRALREAAAKRARLALMDEAVGEMDRLLADDDAAKIDQGVAIGRARAAVVAVKHDAVVYSGHPDYREALAP